MTRKLTDYSVLTFDCYGTLIDWESGIWDALQPVLHRNGRDDIDRAAGLILFAEEEAAQQAETPDMLYPEILRRVHRRIAAQLALKTDDAMDGAFGNSVPHWPAFPDSADALRRLKNHFKLAILSNVHRDGFAASNRKLGTTFDAIYTAQDVGSYKPDPGNFDFMLKHIQADLGVGKDDILHTAQSLRHDHVPATKAGLAKCWIDRQHLSKGGEWGATKAVETRPEVDFLYFTLMELADAVDAAN